jgi:TrmH family RNA methyltransferase
MGSLFQVPVGTGGDLGPALERLQAERFSVVSLELDGALDLREVDWPERLVLVVGNEARGVSEAIGSRADLRVRIPRFGRAESLNAAASVAVILGQICL